MSAATSLPAAAASPGVSIFLPTAARYRSGHLQRAIDSVIAQRYADWELLVVDDASTDGTRDYLASLAGRDARVRTLRLDRNIGLPAFTLAQAFGMARASRFAWLFDDCEFLPDHLSTLMAALDAAPDAGMAYGQAQAELAGGTSFVIGAAFDAAAAATGRNDIANVAVMVRREAIDSVGWYDPHVLMKRLCDWDLWCRIGRRYPLVFIDRVIAIERGTSLPQSLGRTFTLDMDLVRAYVRTDRDARLAPASLVEADCYRADIGVALLPAQARSLDLQLFEHALATGNVALARAAADRLASAANVAPAIDADVATIVYAAAQVLKTRAATAAAREIELETALRRALAAADALGAENARLQQFAATAQSGPDTQAPAISVAGAASAAARDDAAIQAAALAETQMHLRASVAAGEAFRDAADRRAERVSALEAALASANAIGSEFRAAADARMEIITALQQQLAAQDSAASALQRELAAASAMHAAEVKRHEDTRQQAALASENLVAARFTIDESRRVEATWMGRLAFWLHRMWER